MKQSRRNPPISDERRERLAALWGWRCAICGCDIHGGFDIHHAGVHNTSGNRGNYPLLIDSFCNCVPLCRGCHDHTPGFGKMPEAEPGIIEAALRAFIEVLETGELTDGEIMAGLRIAVEGGQVVDVVNITPEAAYKFGNFCGAAIKALTETPVGGNLFGAELRQISKEIASGRYKRRLYERTKAMSVLRK